MVQNSCFCFFSKSRLFQVFPVLTNDFWCNEGSSLFSLVVKEAKGIQSISCLASIHFYSVTHVCRIRALYLQKQTDDITIVTQSSPTHPRTHFYTQGAQQGPSLVRSLKGGLHSQRNGQEVRPMLLPSLHTDEVCSVKLYHKREFLSQQADTHARTRLHAQTLGLGCRQIHHLSCNL